MFNNITKSTQEIVENTAYFCFIGEKIDGHDLIEEAFEKGAVKVFGTKKKEYKNYIQVEDINEKFIEEAKRINKFEINNLKFIGITGTDGKTSTALLIHKIFNKISKCAYLGTSGFIIGEEEVEYNGMTTPFADELYSSFGRAQKEGCEYFVMEVSSHALEQRRLGKFLFDAIVMTNLTNEHLDFHKTMNNYLKSKLKILDLVKSNGIKIVNIDDQYFNYLKEDTEIISISENEEATFKLENIKLSINNTKFCLIKENIEYFIETKLLAKFNVYNLTCAIAVINSFGIKIEEIIPLVKELSVEGRMEIVKNVDFADVIIDFAHTPDSVEKILKYINSLKNTNQKIYIVNGSAGERDRIKRPLIGKIMNDNSDVIILTEDDPRGEKVSNINKDIIAGINDTKYLEINVRSEAIEYAIENANKEDIIILLGKGGQKKMYYENETIEYVEKDILDKILGEKI